MAGYEERAGQSSIRKSRMKCRGSSSRPHFSHFFWPRWTDGGEPVGLRVETVEIPVDRHKRDNPMSENTQTKKPAYCDMNWGKLDICSCTENTGCTYLGVHTTCGPVVDPGYYPNSRYRQTEVHPE